MTWVQDEKPNQTEWVPDVSNAALVNWQID